MNRHQTHSSDGPRSAHNENQQTGLMAGAGMEAVVLTETSVVPEADEVRAYILAMVIELADMADKIGGPRLAGDLRRVGWPVEPYAIRLLKS